MITFVERAERWSVYRCSSGEPVYVAHNAGRRPWLWERSPWIVLDVVTCDRCDALELEEDCTGVTDGDTVCESCLSNSYSRCEDCEEWSTESNTVDGNRNVCDSCRDNYYYCEDCEECVSSDYVNSIGDRVVCDSCRQNNYTYCGTCEEYYPDEDNHADEHSSGCCESPAQTFTLANDGEAPLQNDTRVTVSLPAGTIDSEGLSEIRRLLYGEDMGDAARRVMSIGDKWQTRDGNYTKRLSRTVYNATRVAIPSEILSRIGCIARDHSTAVDFPLEVTRDLNMSAADFYHEDSCWWQSYSEGRCALKTNGGFGLRTFGEYDGVTGRAWVMPLAKDKDNGQLVPTFDTVGARAFVVFNGYGKLEGYTPARILAHMTGWTYRKISFTCRPMFVNGDVGYLVAPEDIAARYTDGSLSLNVDKHSSLYSNERVMQDA